ncbi:glycosyltransferase [Streptomyces sp. NPDC048057]|uniref:glycosyltransferase family 2 protein n=1 Tax=Streptomyces sp. NPDC048057 TaxID=3155628 RepID=UPI0033DB744D
MRTSPSLGPPGSGCDPVALSVVVPTRDRTTRLLLTLTALGQQTLPPDRYEVVLVNDAADATGATDLKSVLAAVPDHVPLRTAATGGRGPARARNQGAALARGEVLLFLDDDTVATPGLLDAHLRAHRAAGPLVVHGAVTDLSAFALTPDPAVLRPALVGARGRSIDAAALADLPEHARLFGPRRSFIERTARAVLDTPGRERLHWLACIGTNTSVRRTVFDRVGGFDEHYGDLWGGEDLELGLRLKAAGAAFALLDATAYHLPGLRRDAADLLARFWRLVAERHGDPRLAEVGAFLAGRLTLDALADLLTPAVAPDRARSCTEFPRGVASPGTAASGVVVPRRQPPTPEGRGGTPTVSTLPLGPAAREVPPSSALDSTAPDTDPSPTRELRTGPGP